MNDSPVALVTVRASSGRLPKKCFLPLGEYSVLEHVVRRLQAGGFFPVICTSTHPTDVEIVELAKGLGVDYFQGDLDNKLNRWKVCMQQFSLKRVHLVDADDPYFDPIEMHRSYRRLLDTGFDLVLTSWKSDSGFASVGSSVTSNFMSELVTRSKALKSSNFDVIPWDLLLHPTDSVLIMPDNDLGFPLDIEMRLTLDYPEDHELLKILGAEFTYDAPRVEIERFLVSHPELRLLNLFRGKDFLQNKEDFKSAHFI